MKLTLTLLQIFLILTLTSCGSRKRVVAKKETTIKLDSIASSIKTIDLNKIINQIKFVPVNIDKPMIVNRDTIYNTRIEFVQKSIDSVVYIKDTVMVEKEVEIKSKDIDSEKKGFNWKGLSWTLIFVIILVLVLVFYKRKRL